MREPGSPFLRGPDRPDYWKSSLNMAQPDAGDGEGESIDERLRLNTFPRPARAKQMAESMMSFFIVFQTYTRTRWLRCRVAIVGHGSMTSDGAVTVP